jgi:hypothetical protein
MSETIHLDVRLKKFYANNNYIGRNILIGNGIYIMKRKILHHRITEKHIFKG